jgi:hypothetical protein
MTHELMHQDPDTEPLLCSDKELARAGFSVHYRDEMPDTDGEFVGADGEPLDIDVYLADADLETPEGCEAALRALRKEMQSDGQRPPHRTHERQREVPS